MEENLKSKLGFWTFFLLVLTLLIGGYFLTNYLIKNKNILVINKDNTEKDISLKIDDNKDFIYYINEEVISEEAEIMYKDVVINLNTQTTLNESLEKENKIFKNNIMHISEQNLATDKIISYHYDDLYALTFRDYKDYEFGKYVSLVINEYNYSCFDAVTFNKVTAYVFNTKEGKLLSSDEMLNMYNVNMDIVKEKVRNDLNSKQSEVDGNNLILVDSTLEIINLNGLYINEYGKLMISYLVKTTQTDYNEITEVN